MSEFKDCPRRTSKVPNSGNSRVEKNDVLNWPLRLFFKFIPKIFKPNSFAGNDQFKRLGFNLYRGIGCLFYGSMHLRNHMLCRPNFISDPYKMWPI